MLCYTDTSMLVKRYVNEIGTIELETRLEQEQPTLITSELVRVELMSALNRKVRGNEIPPEAPMLCYARFLEDVQIGLIALKPLGTLTIQDAIPLMKNHTHPVASLDALHLATALRHKAQSLFTTDKQLGRAARAAGLEVWGI